MKGCNISKISSVGNSILENTMNISSSINSKTLCSSSTSSSSSNSFINNTDSLSNKNNNHKENKECDCRECVLKFLDRIDLKIPECTSIPSTMLKEKKDAMLETIARKKGLNKQNCHSSFNIISNNDLSHSKKLTSVITTNSSSFTNDSNVNFSFSYNFDDFRVVDSNDWKREYDPRHFSTDTLRFYNSNGFINLELYLKQKKYITLNNQIFTNTVPFDKDEPTQESYKDHEKIVLLSESKFPSCGLFIYECYLRCHTINTEKHPFSRDINGVEEPLDDLRLGCGGIRLYDPDTHIIADIVMTNLGIYALYGRLYESRQYDKSSFCFLECKRIGSYSPKSKIKVSISYDSKKNVISWYVEGTKQWKVNRIGYKSADYKKTLILLYGGKNQPIEKIVHPRGWCIGFGTWTYLDAHRPNNEERSNNLALVRLLPNEEDYLYPIRTNSNTGNFDQDIYFHSQQCRREDRLWDQGVCMDISSLKILYK